MKLRNLTIPDEELAKFCRAHRIRSLAIFGSALRSDFRPDSDIDILVEFEPGTRVGLNFFRIERELSELLGRKVDLNTPGFLSDDIREKAAASAETIYDAASV